VTSTAPTHHDAPTLCVSGPAELVQVVPHLVGIRPDRSLVLVVLRGERVQVVVRADLADVLGTDEAGAAELVDRVRVDADRAVLVVYGERCDVADGVPAWTEVSRIVAVLESRGIAVLDALYVAAGRWWSYVCCQPGCCGPAGTALPPHDAPSPVRAAALDAGLRVLPDRGAVRAEHAPVGTIGRLRRELDRAEQRVVAAVASDGGIGPWRRQVDRRFLVARDALAASRLSRAQTAALVVSLVDPAVRDRCWERVEAGPDQEWLALWRHLARRALPPYRAEPLFLLGWTAWRRGDGITAGVAVEGVLAEDPCHRAGGMLLELLRAGTDPRSLPCLLDGEAAGGRAGR